MLCSERELLLSDEREGVIELDPAAEPGTPAARALGLDDPVFDVAITPNRATARASWVSRAISQRRASDV